tara:strand:+ start:2194 stop:2835 length:642 start_codon:yes stop_codon:yes gene_type:complete
MRFRDVADFFDETKDTLVEMADEDLRNENRRNLANLGQQTYDSTESIREDQEVNNGILVMSGDHGGFKLTKYGTHLHGSPGALVFNKGIVRSNATLENLLFTRTDDSTNNSKTLLHIENNAAVLIRNCIFERKPDDPASVSVGNDESFVLIENGCRVIFLGCTFRFNRAPTAVLVAGAVIKNRGVAGNVFAGIGFNQTTQNHVNVTAITPELA